MFDCEKKSSSDEIAIRYFLELVEGEQQNQEA